MLYSYRTVLYRTVRYQKKISFTIMKVVTVPLEYRTVPVHKINERELIFQKKKK